MAKLSVPLIVTDDGQFPRTPWHCILAVGVDGSYSTVHSRDVRDTHVLIYHKGQPYYWRQRSALWDNFDQGAVMFEPRYPKTLLIYQKDPSKQLALDDDQISNLRQLAEVYRGDIRISGFTNAADVIGSPRSLEVDVGEMILVASGPESPNNMSCVKAVDSAFTM
jgi:hypothetical protein